jgi:hypothetical protein
LNHPAVVEPWTTLACDLRTIATKAIRRCLMHDGRCAVMAPWSFRAAIEVSVLDAIALNKSDSHQIRGEFLLAMR